MGRRHIVALSGIFVALLIVCSCRHTGSPPARESSPPQVEGIDRLSTAGYTIQRIVFLEDGRHLLAVGYALPGASTVPAASTRPTTQAGTRPSTRAVAAPATRRLQTVDTIWPPRPVQFLVFDVTTGRRVRTFGEFAGPPASIALIPGSTQFVALTREGVSIWDHQTGRKVRDLERLNPNCGAVTVSGNGRYLAVTAASAIIWHDNQPPHTPLVVYDLHTGQRVKLADAGEAERPDLPSMRSFLGPGNPGYDSAAFSPDGTLLAAAVIEYNFSIRVWRMPEGREIARMFGHTRPVRRMAFSNDGLRLFTCSDDRTVRTWDTLSGKELACQDDWRGPVPALALSGDRMLMALATEPVGTRDDALNFSVVELRRTADFAPVFRIQTIHNSWGDVALSPDGKLVATAPGSRSGISSSRVNPAEPAIRLWRAQAAETFAPVRAANEVPATVFRGHVQAVVDAAFSPDGSRVYTGGVDQTIRTWDAASGKQLGCYTMPQELRDYSITRGVPSAISADGRWALYGRKAPAEGAPRGVNRSEYVLHDLQQGHDIGTFNLANVRGPIGRCLLLPDGRRAILGEGTPCMWLVDVVKGDVLQMYDVSKLTLGRSGSGRVNAVSLSQDGSRLGVSTWNGAGVFDVKSGQIVAQWGGIGFELAPDGKRALSSNGNGLSICDIEKKTNKSLGTLAGVYIFCAAWSGDGRKVAVLDSDLQIHVMDIEGKRLGVLRGLRGPVNRLRFDEQGRRLLAASHDGTARVWTLSTE